MRTFVSTLMILLAAGGASAADLSSVQSVYAWPMRQAFDQYLAEQLSAEGVFDIVVDPKLAGAVLTDRIDAPFLEAMDELFPLPEEKQAEEEEEELAEQSIEAGGVQERPVNRAFSRPHGTLFLVDVRSRKVLWSTFLKEYEPSPNKLHKQARNVVQKLKKEMGAMP